jgi:hypothetical protein
MKTLKHKKITFQKPVFLRLKELIKTGFKKAMLILPQFVTYCTFLLHGLFTDVLIIDNI